jgi:polyribonucleotide nucleotidyltransferase
MGLITNESGENAILTDIQGAEDHSGDMDFKVAGTPDGVTALQMDIKVKGISFEIMAKALDQAKVARLEIIDHILNTIAEPREELNEFAPRMITVKIPTEKIGAVIGPGGKVIRGMIEEFGVTIDVGDDGTIIIGASDGAAGDAAKAQIELMTKDLTVGDRFNGKVSRIMAFGAFVEIAPGKDGLVHISELADHRVDSVESVVQIGDPLEVEVIEIDRMGRINLTANLDGERRSDDRPPGHDSRGDRGGRGGDRRGRGGDRGGDRGGRGGYRGGRDGDRGGRPSGGNRDRDSRPRNDDRGPRRGGGNRRQVGSYGDEGGGDGSSDND